MSDRGAVLTPPEYLAKFGIPWVLDRPVRGPLRPSALWEELDASASRVRQAAEAAAQRVGMPQAEIKRLFTFQLYERIAKAAS